MAKNRKRERSNILPHTLAGTLSGAPVVVGKIPGVALTDSDSANSVSVQHDGVFDLSVQGIDGVGNSAVAVGDDLYYNSADTPKINKKSAGVFFGNALEAVASGATSTIEVRVGR